jgi:acyl-CoA synthetase (AMP-forming)/AMP-acid ligase II
LVTINPAYRLHEFVNTLNLVGVSHLFMVPEIRASHYTSLFSDAFPALRDSAQGNIQEPALPALRSLVVVNNTADPAKFENDLHGLKSAIDWREIMVWREDSTEKRLHEEISASLDKDDVISLQFTSGTTGSPKAVSLTHSNLLNNALSIGRCMRLTPEDVLCNAPPLFHCFGLVLGNLAAWSHGSCVVYPSAVFEAAAIVDAVVHEKCSVLHGVPTHFLSVLAEVERRQQAGEKLDFSRLRTGVAGAAPVPIELMKKLISKLNLTELTVAYGMTETSPIAFQTSAEDSLRHRTESVGRVQPHVKAKLVNPKGETVPVGTPGEVCISGYLTQKGYWNDQQQTRSAMRRHPGDEVNLWMHTGDKGIMDKDGYLRIVGRIKDIIIRGGENLFPVQIEDVIARHPAILEAAAVAVPDEQFGEVVGAWVVRQPNGHISREEVRRSVGESINPQNAPAWVWFAGENGTPEALPKTASGKVMKHLLREWSRDLAKKDVGRSLSF